MGHPALWKFLQWVSFVKDVHMKLTEIRFVILRGRGIVIFNPFDCNYVREFVGKHDGRGRRLVHNVVTRLY